MSLQYPIKKIKQLIEYTEKRYHRAPGSVLLLAVSKQQSASAIEEAYQQGITQFGENYVQEAQEKMSQLQHLNLDWHFIGPIQGNKTKSIAASFAWVHSLDRIKIATLLNQYRPDSLPPLNVCLQIKLIEEPTKAGINPEELKELAYAVSQLPNLNLRGLMTIPPAHLDSQTQYQTFAHLKQLMSSLNTELQLTMDTLSMGMSDDLIPAIRAGATIVRIGRAIFGERHY